MSISNLLVEDTAACEESSGCTSGSESESEHSPPSSSSSSSNTPPSNTAGEDDSQKRGWVAPFLLHLHQMLRRESPDIVRWTTDGMAFQILNKTEMTNQILPKYFKNKNFASFQRQLNYFGFRKWSKARAEHPTYSREYFCRDDYDAMSLVKRQSKKSKKRKAGSMSSSSSMASNMEEMTQQQSSSSLVKRPHLSPTKYIGTEKCKPILPKVQLDLVGTEVSMDATSPVYQQAGVLAPSMPVAMPMPLMPVQLSLPMPLSVASPIPVISPTRKIPQGCKLPSLRSMFVTSTPWASCVKN